MNGIPLFRVNKNSRYFFSQTILCKLQQWNRQFTVYFMNNSGRPNTYSNFALYFSIYPPDSQEHRKTVEALKYNLYLHQPSNDYSSLLSEILGLSCWIESFICFFRQAVESSKCHFFRALKRALRTRVEPVTQD